MILRTLSLLALCSVVLFTACAPATVSLDYLPNPASNQRGPSTFNVGSFVDERGVQSNYLGGIGLPGVVKLERIYTQGPVEDSVRNAFLHALDARRMLSSRPQFVISGTIKSLYCEMLKDPYAYAEIYVEVKGPSGRVVYAKRYTGERQSVFFVPGSTDPVPVLRNLTSRALQDAVDHAIDDPEMRDAMRHSRR